MKDRTKNSNNKFVDVPKYKIVGFTTISVPEIKTQLHVNTETYGKRYLNSQGTQEAPDFTLVNAKLNVKLYKGLDFNFGVNNLLDRDYYWSYGFPQAGRNFLTGVSYNFLIFVFTLNRNAFGSNLSKHFLLYLQRFSIFLYFHYEKLYISFYCYLTNGRVR